jgi:hypothetical protein
VRAAEIEWRVLRGSIILLVVAVVITAGSLVGSYQFASSKNKIHKREQAKYLSARAQYHTLDVEEGLIAIYLPRYVALENAGIIGREKRLDWIESLRQSAKQSQVAKMQYDISAQKLFETKIPLDVGDYKIYASTMRLNVGLLHEGDLFTLLDNLNSSITSLYGLSECDLKRKGAEISNEVDAVNLSARCNLNFLTIRKSDSDPS